MRRVSFYFTINCSPLTYNQCTAYFTSQTTLNTAMMSDDTISITSTVPSTAPELPRRSNSIISMTSHNSFSNFDHHKSLLSPRVQLHQSTVSPKVLDPLTEDLRSMEFQPSDPISPSCYVKSNVRLARAPTSITHNDINERSSPSYNPSSPRHVPLLPELNDKTNGPLPISPHVNVPNAHSFNHQPPPLPPRARKKNPIELSHSQLRQAKDAPPLLPRDKSPPPLPPRCGGTTHNHNHSGSGGDAPWNHLVSSTNLIEEFKIYFFLCCLKRDDPLHLHHMTQLTTPETSTIMLRRNSALAHSKDGSSTATTPKSLNSSFEAKYSPGAVGKKQR